MVVSIVAVVAGIVLTSFEPTMHDQVRGAAQIVASDLAAAQSLAVTNNTRYRFTFDRENNLYYLEHSGSNPTFDNLPSSAFGLPNDPATRRTTDLARLPFGATNIRLYVVQEQQAALSPTEVTTLEFGPLGETTRSMETMIWLTAGRDTAARFLPLTVHPITGIATIGEIQTQGPYVAGADMPGDTLPGDGMADGGTPESPYDYSAGSEAYGADPSEPTSGDGTGSHDPGTGSSTPESPTSGYPGDGSP